ncbi:uncharacterized protein V6R79_008741 [Siganus canaliculatus]
MASADQCGQRFQCSICLDTFSEPVSTPCGHNYCKTCITKYWAGKEQPQCPLCKKKFRKKPELQVNTDFRDMVEHLKNMRVSHEDDMLVKPGEVLCDFCFGPKLKACKTCLWCLASYCQHHLEELHHRVPTFKKHQLIEPVSNLQDRVCKKHEKVFELFCHVDQEFVCYTCLQDDHVQHEAIPLEHAFRERKAQLHSAMSEMIRVEEVKTRSIEKIKCTSEKSKNESEKETGDIDEVFVALTTSLQRSKVELMKLIQEKQKAAESHADELVSQLEEEVSELKRRRSEMEELLRTEDPLHLLQSCPCLYTSEDHLDPLSHSNSLLTSHLDDISPRSYMGMVKRAVAQMEKTLRNEMEMLLHEVGLSDGWEAAAATAVVKPHSAGRLMNDGFIKETWSPPQDKLMMIQQCDAVDVTLDPYTANTKLVVSEDEKQVRLRDGQLFFPGLFWKRFLHHPFVLATEGFSSGRFYYEVQVSGSKSWLVGVVKESLNREMFGYPLPNDGAWTFLKLTNQLKEEYFGNFLEPPLSLKQSLHTVGVFVDYEKGEVSFYDVEARTLIHSYTECIFSGSTPALKAFLYSMTGSSVSKRPKLYPVFGLYGEDSGEALVITPVACST